MHRRFLVSIHDVAPGTLGTVLQIVDDLRSRGIHKVTLLVIPGRGWDADGIGTLRALAEQGCELAGHGWLHQCAQKSTWYHKLHGWCLSRDVAEHLSLDNQRIAALIRRCFAWFEEVGLGQPQLYVPPAWAMGPIRLTELRDLPFQYYELLTGVYDAAADRFHRLPLLGYEADTLFRSLALRCLNPLNGFIATRLNRPIRMSIHPHDPQLLLSKSLQNALGSVRRPVSYTSLSSARATDPVC